jgi:hypothetical protein
MTLEDNGAPGRVPFIEWSRRVPEPKSGTLDFDRFPFQRELYEQTTEEREVVVKKATQVGISTLLVRWAMYWPDQAGLTALYIFPRERQLNDFSATRIGPTIAASDYLRGRVAESDVQKTMLKQIGSGYLVLRGSESLAGLQSVDADVLVLDENDLLVQDHVPDAERRLGASDHGLIRRVGVPSLPGFGIADLYGESDRRSWHVRCAACSERQRLSFQQNVDVDRLLRVCRRCRRELDVRDGEWVAEYPDRDVRGYHVPRLIVPRLDVAALVRSSRDSDPSRRQAFFNKDLGEEYAQEDARLTAAVIEAAQRDYLCVGTYDGSNPVTMGVDVASVRGIHVRISEHFANGEKRAVFLGEVDGFEALVELVERYGVHQCAIDSQPEHRLARGFAERFPGRVFLVSYAGASALEPFSVDLDRRRVTVSRVDLIDEALELIRRQKNLLPRRLPVDYVQHLQSVIRILDRDPAGRPRSRYHSIASDDYLHAEVFDVVAFKLLGFHALVDEISEPEYVSIEEALPGFRRSDLSWHFGDDPDYYPGPAEPSIGSIADRDVYGW